MYILERGSKLDKYTHTLLTTIAQEAYLYRKRSNVSKYKNIHIYLFY